MSTENTGNIGFEETLWKAADKLRSSMDAAEYKYVVLGLIFLKYISDKFETRYEELIEEGDGFEEDRDEYAYKNIFWVPKEARWDFIKDNAKDPKIGQFIDDAMILIEKENPSLKGVLDKRYARPELDKRRLGELIDLISTIKLHKNGEKDLLGRVYEYFLGKFADAEGKGGGEFYTPTSVVKTLVQMIEPYEGRIYDPCCGSGGMFIQSKKFVEEHQGKIGNLSIYGQELNSTTWKLCRMNLAIRGLEGNIGPHHDDTFHNDLHKTLKADFILANPPFNISDWGGDILKDDVRWKYGTPPEGNANYAWLQHIIYHLAPNGVAGIVLANGSLSTSTSNEGEIRKNMLEADLVDAIVALPDKLFYSTGIPVSLWILNRNKSACLIGADKSACLIGAGKPACHIGAGKAKFRNREHEVLVIDARNLGDMIDRRHRELKDEDIFKIADTYHKWRLPALAAQASHLTLNTEQASLHACSAQASFPACSAQASFPASVSTSAQANLPASRTQASQSMLPAAEEGEKYEAYNGYEDIQGFCYSATIEEIREHEYVLTPGRYVGIEEVEDDGIPFEEKMENLTGELGELFAKSKRLEEEIRKNLGGIGYEF